MKIFDQLIGNEDIKNTLGVSIANSSFSHAYIIEGAEGTGKRTVAKLAAAAIMCRSKASIPCGECPTCKKILNDNCADVRILEITKVEQARELKAGLYDSSVECEYKVYIIENAHKMNIKAQNALLISLEEPPKNVVFFLLTADSGALLETIRSRAQLLRTKRLDEETVFDYIRKNRRDIAISDDKLRQIIKASYGSLGYAMEMSDKKSSEALISKRARAVDFVSAILRDDNDAVSFLMSLSSLTRDELKELLLLAYEIIGDLLSVKRDREPPLYFFTSAQEANELCSKYSITKVISVCNALSEAYDALNSNTQTAITLMTVLINSAKKGK